VGFQLVSVIMKGVLLSHLHILCNLLCFQFASNPLLKLHAHNRRIAHKVACLTCVFECI